MNGKDIFLGLQFIGDDLVEEAEVLHFSARARSNALAHEKKRGAYEEKTYAKSRRTLLVAIVCLLALLLAGCCVAYMLSLRQLTLGTEKVPIPESSPISESSPEDSTSETQLAVFSLQGIEGTPNYQASQEWLAFTQSYTPSAGDCWDSNPAYWAYSVQDQTMVDKLDEICAKYGLSVIGKPWHEQVDCSKFLPLLGIDSLLKPDTDAALSIPAGRYFPGGSFTIYGTLSLGEASETFTYQCVKKDVFYDVFGYTNPDTVTERNYTTSDGVPLLFLESEQSGMILANREDCFLSLSITLTGSVTLEQIAECFDFTISPQAPDPAAADAREQTSNDTINSMSGDPNICRRPTYGEYVQDVLNARERDKIWYAENPEFTPPEITYAFYDADGNGTQELLMLYNGYICSIVGMKDGVTDEGKSYYLLPYEDHVFIEWPGDEPNALGDYWYDIFRFANNDDPVFSTPKERIIVRLKKDANGNWWRTSSTDRYAEFDTQITEDEAQAILDSYKPITLETHPLSEFREP